MSSSATSAALAATEQAIVRKVAWRLMPLIMVCYLFAFFDRINISFAKFQLQADLSLSNTAYGLGAGLFVVGYVLFEVPSNLYMQKTGARRSPAHSLSTPAPHLGHAMASTACTRRASSAIRPDPTLTISRPPLRRRTLLQAGDPVQRLASTM